MPACTFICRYYNERMNILTSDCGYSCDGYNPCNGKNGACRFHKKTTHGHTKKKSNMH